jgi:glutamine amidotransferase
MVQNIGFESETLTKPSSLYGNSLFILPGVGSFDEGMTRLKKFGWDIFLKESALDSTNSILGLCLGMQLLCDQSEEGKLEGLGLIPGHFRHFRSFAWTSFTKKVPHMGWNQVEFVKSNSKIYEGLGTDSRYYFVHSYAYSHSSNEFVDGMTNYGIAFPSIIRKGKILGLQFHPEKSHKYGKELLGRVISKF